MTEDVMENNFIKQKNDYALSKWVSEIQIMNSREMFNTETVRIRIFNTYGQENTLVTIGVLHVDLFTKL